MAFSITDTCNRCGECTIACPTGAIMGCTEAGLIIDLGTCIECGICGNVCPQGAIADGNGQPVPHMQLDRRPRVIVDEEKCIGCGFCSDICPLEAMAVTETDFSPSGKVASVDKVVCLGCTLCVNLCPNEALSLEPSAQMSRS